jgi:hypothetical protein
MNPYVFFVGSARSGTTLLQRLADAHPELAVIQETLWITRFHERRKGLTAEAFATPKLVEQLLANRRFLRLGLDPADLGPLLDGGRRPYADFVTGVFDLYGRAQGKPLVGDKSPGYVRSIPTLHALWPDARFVHLIRDGRDVALSALSWRKADKVFRDFRGYADDPWTTAALWWERSVRLGREAAATLPPPLYAEVRYEALVADPERECRRLCVFLGLPYDGAMLRFHEGRTRADAALPSKRRWLPPTQGLRDWRTDMSREAVERFEAAAGPMLEELGYPRGVSRPSPGSLERASAALRVFSEDVRTRRRPLPEEWT